MSMDASVVRVRLNGEPRVIPAGLPILQLLVSLGLPPQIALVEHNGHALFRADWERIQLAEGDQLEILRVVAGG